jgi:pimeloyl-ACP methyl ester carboxylesterase
MELFFRQLGSGAPIVILHGLYGSANNWYSIGRELATDHTVFLVDQRNHGNSPHHPEHNYDVLSNDLNEFVQKQHLNKSIIIGHSMGGKTALAFGLKFPERVEKMIVVDISPLGYESHKNSPEDTDHERIIRALQSMDPGLITSREDADKQLRHSISSQSVRQFLLKNLKRMPDGNFKWALNIQALAENRSAIFAGVIHEKETDPSGIPYFPLLFIKGEFSGYIRSRDEEAIHRYFPRAEFIVIPGTGHWVHAEQPGAFLKAVRNFIRE